MVVSGEERAVRDVLERIRAGWEQMDVEAVLSCFADDPRTVVIGTDEEEYWTGFDAFAGPFRQMTDAFTDASYRWGVDEPTVEVQGDIAWSTGRLMATFVSGETPVELNMRTTHVLRNGSDGWRIVQGHYSVAAAESTAYA
jgi:uncharacterized protein (TIGR02246 family)